MHRAAAHDSFDTLLPMLWLSVTCGGIEDDDRIVHAKK
jgi:hypothetical protein